MQLEIAAGGKTRHVTVTRTGATFAIVVDGHPYHVDAARIDAHRLSLIVDNVWSHETVVTPDVATGQWTVVVDGVPVAAVLNGRRRGSRGAEGDTGPGPQRVTAPMPGKVVRVLVKSGDAVDARQPLVVVEAMKMENELRAVKAGTVSDVQAREGHSVDAGALLVVIQ